MKNQKRNPDQPQNIGRWEAWTTHPQGGSAAELHVKGSFPADEKNPNFRLRQITSPGQGTSEIVLELDHQGINPTGKEQSSIKEFKTSLGSKKYDSVIIRSKGIDHVATVPIKEKESQSKASESKGPESRGPEARESQKETELGEQEP